MLKIARLHSSDNVLVALQDLKKGEIVNYASEQYEIAHDIAAKHKFVTKDLNINDHIIMYGIVVGKVKENIKKGAQISTFNIVHEAESYSSKNKKTYSWEPLDVTAWENKTFMGYHRKDGKVGTRNFWLVVPLVFCENRNILILKEAFEKELGYAQADTYKSLVHNLVKAYKNGSNPNDLTLETSPKNTSNHIFENIDGIKFLTHEGGCGGTRHDAQVLCKLFAAYALHPNVAGITVLSLGCQNSEYEIFLSEIKANDPAFSKPILFFEQQKGTEHDLLESAIKDTFQGLIEANKINRQPAPISKLNIGLKCGGSDGFSGISANPALGHLSDIMVSLGGKTLLAEFPELHGVEQELIDRCIKDADSEKFESLMRTYSAKAEAVGSSFAFNPSPGNIKDGLITDAIKSAGAAKKGGNAPISGVLDYAEIAQVDGLHLVCTPGNDVEAVTGKVASGATVVLFTTGLGTPTGNPVSPVVKVSTNNTLANKMSDVIDFNCGSIIEGTETIEQCGERLLEYVIALASGETICQAERLGQNDFIPWKRGISL